jgi:predicted dehydrogenase
MSNDPVNVAVVGCGYWGPNLIRNLSLCPGARVVAVCDPDATARQRAVQVCPTAEPLEDFESVLARDDVEAVVIATPMGMHAPQALAALEAGFHVLVEKPLATRLEDAKKMVALAAQRDLILMVDHTFVYSPPVTRIKEIMDAGELGDIHFIDSVRINLGLIQEDANVLWDLAPHDLSIVEFLIQRRPQSVTAFGSCHTGTGGHEDVAYMGLDYGEGLIVTLHVNWLSPVKIRHFIIGGSKKSLVYNHLDLAEPVKVYDSGITLAPDTDTDTRRNIVVNYRTGDVWSPYVDQSEALKFMAADFVSCVRSGQRPLADGQAGQHVVAILEAAQRSLKAGGTRVEIDADSLR